MRIDRNQRNLGIGPGFDFRLIFAFAYFDLVRTHLLDLFVNQLYSRFHGLGRRFLQVGIQSGVDAIGLLIQLALVVLADQRIANQVYKVGRVTCLNVGWSQLQRGSLGLIRFCSSNGVGFDHAFEH